MTTADAGEERDTPAVPEARPVGNRFLAVLFAWLVPGAGHVYLRRRGRGAIFFALVLFALAFGCLLQGRLYSTFDGHPLIIAASLGSLGAGLPYFALHWLGYEGVPLSAGFEYGTTFLITAGLMNLLLMLDAWDISTGHKS